MSPTQIPAQPGGSGTKTALVTGALLALVAANVYLFIQVTDVRGELAKFRASTLNDISSLRDASTVTQATQKRHIETLRTELEESRRQANQLVGQAKSEAQARAERLAKELQAQEQRAQQVASELSQVKQDSSSTSAKLSDVTSDVGNVKTQVASTKSELDKTIADLKRVTGDLGVTSGLVATNGKELAALKRLGERNYFEFTIAKSKRPQRVSDITIQLKKTDPKRNKFTIDVMADDKKYEKKDKNANEPVQFYVAKARQPYEIVVNKVTKNEIVGYLATPKDQVARN